MLWRVTLLVGVLLAVVVLTVGMWADTVTHPASYVVRPAAVSTSDSGVGAPQYGTTNSGGIDWSQYGGTSSVTSKPLTVHYLPASYPHALRYSRWAAAAILALTLAALPLLARPRQPAH